MRILFYLSDGHNYGCVAQIRRQVSLYSELTLELVLEVRALPLLFGDQTLIKRTNISLETNGELLLKWISSHSFGPRRFFL